MRFFAITAALLAVLAAAFLALPIINTAAAMDSQVPAVQELVSVDSAPEAAIPVTDLIDAAAVPVALVEEPAGSVETAAPVEDDLAQLAAAEATAEAAAQAAQAAAEQVLQAELDEFVASVTNGWSSVVTGVYVPNGIAIPVGQQPAGNAGFITTKEGSATQFSLASDYGAIGILAHNYLAGDQFFQLSEGMQVYVIYGDGSYDIYLITEIRRFQALQPNSPYSNFLDLDSQNGDLLSAAQLFDQIYNQPGKLIFQTCIDAHGINTWGRIFINAEPIA